MAQFLLYKNEELIKTFSPTGTPLIIGRLPENEISIPSMDISRRHARIDVTNNNAYEIADLNSLNGTIVNNKKILAKTTLSSGDRIIVGTHMLVFEESKEHQKVTYETASLIKGVSGVPTERQQSEETTTPQEKSKTVMQPTPVLIETNRHLVYKIDKEFINMGNSEADDIFVEGPFLEAGHLSIQVKDDGVWLSTKKFLGLAKIKVNGKKVSNHCLIHKDRIEIGNSTFRFMEHG